jgi:hypothetical protein
MTTPHRLALLGIVVVLVGATLVVVSSHRAALSPLSAPATFPPSGPVATVGRASVWNIAGAITQMNGDSWAIQGFIIRIDRSTEIDGDLPSIGTYTEAEGIVQPDTTWLATRVRLGAAVSAAAPSAPSALGSPATTNTPLAEAPESATPMPATPSTEPAPSPAPVSPLATSTPILPTTAPTPTIGERLGQLAALLTSAGFSDQHNKALRDLIGPLTDLEKQYQGIVSSRATGKTDDVQHKTDDMRKKIQDLIGRAQEATRKGQLDPSLAEQIVEQLTAALGQL